MLKLQKLENLSETMHPQLLFLQIFMLKDKLGGIKTLLKESLRMRETSMKL